MSARQVEHTNELFAIDATDVHVYAEDSDYRVMDESMVSLTCNST
jgi:hypothetical protein